MLATILTFITLFTGVLFLADKLYFERKRPKPLPEDWKPNFWLNLGQEFFPLLAAVLVLRSFIAEPFRIPSGSMIPTLLVHDFILVNKFSYGLRTPIGNVKFLETGKPERGDIVVFQYPPKPENDYIKRLIGLPGDQIAYKNKVLTVNGVEAKLEPQGVFTYQEQGVLHINQRFTEDYFGVKHDLLIDPNDPPRDFEYTVPEGQYFMMGDNRDGSFDSRGWGTVPEANLRGRAFFIWLSLSGDWQRIFTVLK
jgi:signal peptidase I